MCVLICFCYCFIGTKLCAFSCSLIGYPIPCRCVEVFAQDDERFRRWMESDAEAAEAKLTEAATAPGAWRAVGWKVGVSKLKG